MTYYGTPPSLPHSFELLLILLNYNSIYSTDIHGFRREFNTATNTSQSSEFFSSPALASGIVVAGTGAGTMYGFDAATGTVKWSFETSHVVVGMNGGTGKAPITGSVVISPSSKIAYVGAWDGCIYAFNPLTGTVLWKFQAIDADSNTKAQIRATPALTLDGKTLHFPAGRALYAIDATNGTIKWYRQTKQVVYSSPTLVPDGTAIYGASGGGMSTAISASGTILWSQNLTQFASTMGAITHDGQSVVLTSGKTTVCSVRGNGYISLQLSNSAL